MLTSRASQPHLAAVRTSTLLALCGGIGWPIVLLARTASWQSSVGAVVASTSLPILLILVAAGHAAAALALRNRLITAASAVALLLASSAVWALASDTDWPDPTGHGLLAPRGTPTWLAVLTVLAALAGGWFLGRMAAASAPFVTRFPSWVVTAAAAMAASLLTALAHNSRIGAGIISQAVAVILAVVAAALSPTAACRLPLTCHGAVIGLVAFTPGSIALLARQSPERSYVTNGVLRVVGPLVPLMMWTILLAACLGVVLTVVGAGVGALVTRRLNLHALRTNYRHIVAALMAGGFVLRVVALLTVNTAQRDAGDPFFYHVTANLLAQGRGFEEPVTWVRDGAEVASALHGPAFPALLSLWSRLGGTGYFDHQLASIVLGLPQVLAVVVLARLLAGRRAAVIAGVLVAVYPNIWITDGALFVEGLMAVFTTVATWCVYRFRAAPHRGWVAALGVLIALAALTRGEALLLLVLLLVPIVALTPGLQRRDRWRHLIVGGIAFVATLLPWMAYNAGRFEVFVPLSTNSNEVLYYANCDDVYSGHAIGFWSFACQVRYREEHGEAPGDQAEQSVFWRGLAVDYVKDHIDQIPKVVLARVGRQWELFRPSQTIDFAFIEGRPRRAVEIGQDMYYAMMLLAVPGTLALRRRGTPSWPLWSHAVAVTLTAAYAYGALRFRAPFEPILCVFAAIGGVWLFDLARSRRSAPSRGGELVLPG